MEEDEVVYIKVFDGKKGDLVFEGKVSTDVVPEELVRWRCFQERGLKIIHDKATNERVTSFKGLQNNVELVAVYSDLLKGPTGVLYEDDNAVLRRSTTVLSCKAVIMILWNLSHEECEKVVHCETLQELFFGSCQLKQIPREIGKLHKLKKLRIYAALELEGVSEEIGDLSNLEELWIGSCGFKSLPKRLKDLKMLKSIAFEGLSNLQLNADDLVVVSKLKRLKILWCRNAFNNNASFSQLFWEMIKLTTELHSLQLDWHLHNGEVVVASLEENGSIVHGGFGSAAYANIFKRNKANHERAMECVVLMLAIRRWRNVLNNVPKEMVKMIAMMLWMMRCDVNAWTRSIG